MHDGEQTQARCSGNHEVFRERPFPFPGDRFPDDLGAVIQLTVSNGVEPAREVIHTSDNSWMVGDCVNDPNEPGAVQVACMGHLVDLDASVDQVASLPLGHVAFREDAQSPWKVEPFAGFEE
ncbi:hypothetical protein [Actinoplanes regularis]|uniref:Uncharacterized protein n=1 Tax=Actinoplanes regularis TaxID=52697 RepID=A0A239C8V4_9ACTN|nr:hypothetical protein [Actinoplanes regularis]GIE92295.1 hypothetical protein Are01nite_87750 [Actinoplanes regularis]SNS16051.1 hypothetical protein SAMN06264365_11123 [Actinoplanes regularis]